MAQKSKAAPRRTKKPEAAEWGRRSSMSAWIAGEVGTQATACGIGGCYVGTIQEVLADGLVLKIADGRQALLSYQGLELVLGAGGYGGQPSADIPTTPEPANRGIPPEEDVF